MSGWSTRLARLASTRRMARDAWLAAVLLLLLPCAVHRAQAQSDAPSATASGAVPGTVSAPAPPARPRIGLVLSGGGARGAAHIGVLKVLEELRVPVDCIAGTSMGSIVGGSYASGQSIEKMERDVALIKTETLTQDEPSRRDISTRLKESDRLNLIGPQFGWSANGLTLPKGVVSGVALEAVLRDLTLVRGETDFDQLPIPFRAIATDVVSGRMVVLGKGDLAVAMRASMSVPGAVAPVPLGDALLVDGGLTRNLPVDVARGLCADVIIAVNLGTSLLKRDQIASAVSVAAQMLNILTEQNVQASLDALGPQDVLILPELGSFSAANFDGMPSTIPIGEAAARKVADQLMRYSLPEAQYAAHREHQLRPVVADKGTIDEIRIVGLNRVNEEVVVQSMQTQAGQPLDVPVLDADMRRIYGRGDFEHVSYRLINEPDRRVLAVQALEKSWGPDYVRFGMSLATDFSGDNSFNVLASYWRTWLNPLGGEWRTDLQLGENTFLSSEFYQPLVPSQYVFVAPRVQAFRQPADIYSGTGDSLVARYTISGGIVGLDLGSQFTKYGELRVGLQFGSARADLQIGDPILNAFDVRRDIGAVRTRLFFDQLDSIDFPRDGYRLDLQVDSSSTKLGASSTYNRWVADAVKVVSSGANTLQFAAVGGGAIGGADLPYYDYLSFGGFLRMTGYKPGQLRNDSLAYGRLLYSNQIVNLNFLDGVYAGVSLEAARLGQPLVPGGITGSVASVGVFLAVDTPLGPAYLGYGRARDGNSSAYFFLGRPY